MNALFLKAELLRIVRNKRIVVLSVLFPALMFYLFSATGGREQGKLSGVSIQAYFMVSMATYGATNALVTAGGRISIERAAGWNRQLRLAGVGGRTYFTTKLLAAYAMALPGFLTILVLATTIRGVQLPADRWVEMTAAVLLALAPVAALGIWIGYLAGPDAMQLVLGLGTVIIAMIGGMLIPLDVFNSTLQTIFKLLPPYWSTYSGRAALGGHWVGWHGLTVLVLWTVVLGGLVARAYRRDTSK